MIRRLRACALLCTAAALCAAPAVAQDGAPACDHMTDQQLQGAWTAAVTGQDREIRIELGPHPEWAGMVKGSVIRAGSHLAMVGDVNDGTVTLEESADGVHITGTWLGEVDPASCGREIRGDYLRGEDDPPQPFVLRKQASPAATGAPSR